MTMNLDKRLNGYAHTLNDETILAKLSGGDAIAHSSTTRHVWLDCTTEREGGLTDTLRNSPKKDFNRMFTRLHFRQCRDVTE